MGKIADRLARKNNPKLELARTVLKLAVHANNIFDDHSWDDLSDLLGEKLEAMSPSSFEVLMTEVFIESRPRRDCEEVLDEIVSLVHDLAETQVHKDGQTSHLVALPLVISHTQLAWNMSLSEAQTTALAVVFKEHDFVCEDAQVTFLPRILSSSQSSEFLDGNVSRLTRALAVHDIPRALAVVAEEVANNNAQGAADPQPKALQDSVSFGMLVALVTTADSEPFPLTMELLHAMEEAQSDEEDAPATSEDDAEAASIFADIRAVLKEAGEGMALALGVTDVQVLEEPRGWFDGLDTAGQQERLVAVQFGVKALAEEHTGSDVSQLCVSADFLPADPKTETFEIRFHRKSDLSYLGTVIWPPRGFETVDTCEERLLDFLSRENLESVDALLEARNSVAVKGSQPVAGRRPSLH